MDPLSAGLFMLPSLPSKISDCTKTQFVWGEEEGAGPTLVVGGGGGKIWVRHRVDNADTYESPWEHKLHPIPPQPDFLLPKAEASNNRGQYA